MTDYWQFCVIAAVLSVATQLWELSRDWPNRVIAVRQDSGVMDWLDRPAFLRSVVGLTVLHGIVNGAILWAACRVVFAR